MSLAESSGENSSKRAEDRSGGDNERSARAPSVRVSSVINQNCYGCGETGHKSRNCPSPVAPDRFPDRRSGGGNRQSGRGSGRGYGQARHGSGKGPYSSRDSKPKLDKSSLQPVHAEGLSVESLLQKEDKMIVYQLAPDKPTTDIEEWFKEFLPSGIRRSDGVGWIVVLSETITEEQKRSLFETNGNILAIKREWNRMVEDDVELNYQTFFSLAEKHDHKGGKWTLHFSGEKVDMIWKFIALELVYKKFPASVIGVKISPVNDLAVPGGSSRGGVLVGGHVISVLHTNMMDVDEIRKIEKQLRSFPIHNEMFYKPDIFSTLGIYRNNMYKLRPSIYISQRDKKDGAFTFQSIMDENWKYKRSEATKASDEADLINLVNFLKDKLQDAKTTISKTLVDVTDIGKEYSRKVKAKEAEEAASAEASAVAEAKKKKKNEKRKRKESKALSDDNEKKEPDVAKSGCDTKSVTDPVMEKKDHVPEKTASIPDVEDDTKAVNDPVMEKKADDEKKQEHVPEKTASIPDVEDDTKFVKDPVMEKKAEDEKRQEHVPEKTASIPVVEDDTKSAKDPVMEKKAEDEKKQEHVPEKTASIPDVEDDTKSAKDPVMEKKAEDEKKKECVPENTPSMPDVEVEIKSA